MKTILVLLVVITHSVFCCYYTYGCSYPYSYPIPQSYPNPEKTIDPIVCDFDSDDGCGYWNQNELVPFQWHQTYNNITEKGLMIWKWTQLNQSCVFGGRLVSKRFASHGLPQGCLIIKLMVQGSDIREVRIYQGDATSLYYQYGQCIYVQRDVLDHNKWIIKRIRLDTRGGDPNFYIEVLSDMTPNTGFVAIDRIEYNYHNC